MDLTKLDMLAALDEASIGDEQTATSWLMALYGISRKQALTIVREWQAGLKKKPQPDWRAKFIREIS